VNLVFDASVIIARIDPANALHNRAKALFNGSVGHTWLVAALTRAEVLVGFAEDQDEQRGANYFSLLGIHTVPALAGDPAGDLIVRTEAWTQAAARLRAQYRLKLPDAVVLSTALLTGGYVVTLDAKLAAAAREARALFLPSADV
jgi:predicted nucleic acid-binding protein